MSSHTKTCAVNAVFALEFASLVFKLMATLSAYTPQSYEEVRELIGSIKRRVTEVERVTSVAAARSFRHDNPLLHRKFSLED